jgi:hypothetical protein
MLIEVTEKHIKKGRIFDADFCPIAFAIRDKGFDNVAVFSNEVDLGLKEYKPLPRSAQRFVQAFDNRKPVKPFNFKLETA